MGTGYVRNDSGNNIADGNVINASDLDGEFDAIAATLATGGHTHDGTAAEGGPITKLGPSQDLVVTASLVNPKTDNTLDLGTASLEFKDLFIDGTAHIDTLDVDESGTVANNLGIGNNLTLDSDGAIVTFGANAEVTLTHVHDTGLLLNSTMALQFNDASQFIKGASNAILAIGATDEVDLTATLFDVNANLDLSGTALVTGVLTTTAAAVFSGGFTSSGDDVIFTSANADDPLVTIRQTGNNASSSRLYFIKDKGAAGADGDEIGKIEFIADNSAQEQISFAKIQATISESADTDEAGKLEFLVAESNGSANQLTVGLLIEGEHATDGEVDVTIAAGVNSTTTVAGDLAVTTDATVGGTALVTGVLTTTAATVFNGGFAANDGSTITTADNTTQLTLISTDADANVGPNLTLFRNSANPDDNDAIGRINFQAQNDRSGGSTLNYAFIESFILDASDGAESAELTFKIATAGATNNRLKFNATETVFNDTGRDFDFRVETEDGQHSLFVEGSSGNVGMFGDAGVQTIDHYANYTTLTLGNITGGIIQFEDDGTQIAQIFNTATDLVIKNTKGDGDILINGIDNASSFTALKLDMSDAGTAIFNSRVAIADGTASLPSFTFSGDTNTGMYRIGSDVLGLATAGAERVRISASGIAFHGDTATANHLNDYEEGTWTPAISATTGSLTTVNSIIGTYIKIGTKLTVFFSFNVADVGNGSGFLNVADIPFTEDNSALQFYTGIVRARSGNTVTVSSGISELDADGTLYLYGNQVRTGLFHGQVTFKTT